MKHRLLPAPAFSQSTVDGACEMVPAQHHRVMITIGMVFIFCGEGPLACREILILEGPSEPLGVARDAKPWSSGEEGPEYLYFGWLC
jgi:hypothetical protein